MDRPRASPSTYVTLLTLLAAAACHGQAPSTGGGELQALCGASSLPSPGSLAGFMGELHHASTTLNSYGYYRFGNTSTDRPPLVLINGLGSTIGDLPPSILKILAERQEVIVYDNPGMGFTRELHPGQNISILGLAEDAMDFFDTLGLERPNVLGISMGGMIAAALAASNGDRLGKIVLAPGSAGSPNSRQPSPAVMAVIKSTAEGNASASLGSLSAISLNFPLDLPEGVKGACRYVIGRAGAVLDPGSLETTRRQISAIEDYWNHEMTVWDALPALNNSFLLAAGELDQQIPVQNSLAMVSHLRTPWLAIYPRASHLAAVQDEDSFLPLLDNFLQNS